MRYAGQLIGGPCDGLAYESDREDVWVLSVPGDGNAMWFFADPEDDIPFKDYTLYVYNWNDVREGFEILKLF